MEENIRKEMHKEELNFLKEELKRIEARIKKVQYSGSEEVVEGQTLLELRENIMKEIDKFVDIFFHHYTRGHEEDKEDKEDEKDDEI